MSRPDANQLAFDTVCALLDAAHPFNVDIAGTAVSVGVSRGPAPPWPGDGFDAVTPLPNMPPPVCVQCTWAGGQSTITIDHFREAYGRYRGCVTLRAATAARWLVMVNLKSVLEDAADGDAVPALASISLIKRGMPEQAELNRALQRLVSASGLPMRRRKVELLSVRLPGGAIDGGPAAAFERIVHLALLKLDFLDRASAKARGTPLIDLGKLELSAEALAALARMEGEAEEEEDDDDDDEPRVRIKRRVERAVPDAAERRAALELFAYAVENAHDERPGGWHVNDRNRGLWLVTGRIAACSVRSGTIALSVMGPVSTETRAALGAEEAENEAWKAIPGGLYLRFPAGKASVALELLKDPFDRFVDEAMARMRRPLDPADHVPEAVDYVASVVGRPLPQPELAPAATASSDADVADDLEDDEVDAVANREPRVRGRAPIFEHSQRSILSLISDIEQGVIALPDLQRPFVWEDTKVRDLLDSIFVGFPVGTVVLWHTGDVREARAVGRTNAARYASALVIDGQQRLTSLYAVIRGAEVCDKEGERRPITIAFRPRDGRFEVPDAAIRQNPEFLADVSEIWSGRRPKGQIRRELLAALRSRGKEVDERYEEAVEENLDRLAAIGDFRFPVLDIRKTAQNEQASEEDVAEIFVRINNQGMRLGQADFVLTLLSVFHGTLRDRLERRAATLSDEAVIAVDTQQLLRATCAVGFGRAKMKAIYRYLRGVDPTTGDTSESAREDRLKRLDAAADACMEPTTWRDYELRVRHAGFVSGALVASNNAIVNAFAFYVLGQRSGLERSRLDRLTSRWLFTTLLTARYSGASETVFERDLDRVGGPSPVSGEAFERALDEAVAEVVGGDYWSRTLVADLRTQRGRAPAALAFRAAQVVLGTKALFSDQLMLTFLAPSTPAGRAASEQHHLFPRAWLQKKGITDRREINQVANLADVGWSDNTDIGASPPSSYVPRLRDKLGLDDQRWGRMCAEHALPPAWETMPYDTFLQERRRRMADIVRAAFRQLGGEAEAPAVAPPWFLPGAEQVWKQIGDVERALRKLVRDVYVARYGTNAAGKIEAALPASAQAQLTHALKSRPAGAEPLTLLDYLYLGALPPLLTANDVWVEAKTRLGGANEVRQRLNEAVGHIAPVRNEIAHVREVPGERLQKASVACNDVLEMIGGP